MFQLRDDSDTFKMTFLKKDERPKQIEGITGKIKFLRVHDVGTGYGAPISLYRIYY